MLYEQVASLSTEQHYPAQYRNNSKTMCPRPAPGQKFVCNKPFPGNRFPLFPKKDAEKKVEKKAEKTKTDKSPVLKF
jgi:hypothetical protein